MLSHRAENNWRSYTSRTAFVLKNWTNFCRSQSVLISLSRSSSLYIFRLLLLLYCFSTLEKNYFEVSFSWSIFIHTKNDKILWHSSFEKVMQHVAMITAGGVSTNYSSIDATHSPSPPPPPQKKKMMMICSILWQQTFVLVLYYLSLFSVLIWLLIKRNNSGWPLIPSNKNNLKLTRYV